MTLEKDRILTGNLYRVRHGNGWAFTDQPPAKPPETVYQPTKIAKALALAYKLQAAIEEGVYSDRAEMARQLGFSRARVTQILGLTLLAPDIQEDIAFLEWACLHLVPELESRCWLPLERLWVRFRFLLPIGTDSKHHRRSLANLVSPDS